MSRNKSKPLDADSDETTMMPPPPCHSTAAKHTGPYMSSKDIFFCFTLKDGVKKLDSHITTL